MYRLIRNSNMPAAIKWILYILLAITMIYWIIILTYKILEYTRRFMSFVSEKRNWWTFICCIFILLIGTFIVAQFVLGLDPFGKFINSIIEKINEIKNNLLK